jgi:hypothetical protein
MKDRQDGRGVADYVANTARDIERIGKELGKGGTGLHQPAADAARRGVTPALAAETEARAAGAAGKTGRAAGKAGRRRPPEDGGRGH